MEILLHTPDSSGNLSSHYKAAFNNAVELFVITAYLTEWDSELILNPLCRGFRIIIGSNFGITRKAACEKVLRWLPPDRKIQFLVADGIDGFHPKAVFWKDSQGNHFALIGSSNLTRAAFETNYEANVYFSLTETEYKAARRWVKEIERQCSVVSEKWLKLYKEASPARRVRCKRPGTNGQNVAPLVELKLPMPAGMPELLQSRRQEILAYKVYRVPLERLFRRCALNQITSAEFYEELPKYWSSDAGDRFQGDGWQIRGKHSDFQSLSRSFVRILDAATENPDDGVPPDDVVSEQIDRLNKDRIPTRGAFLSEMLCLRFPEAYPVLNEPVWEYLKAVDYKPPRDSSEGNRFIFLAQALRLSLRQNPDHLAKNLAELDTVIWLAYGKKNG